MHRLWKLPLWCALVCLCTAPALADTTQEVVNKAPNGLALTPPMGWNSWNKFACDVNEKIVRATADAMVRSGMRDAGYQYVVIDDCWQGPRDANGIITADTQRFPSGIKALADYVHSRGLEVGIYSDVGRLTIRGRSGRHGAGGGSAVRPRSFTHRPLTVFSLLFYPLPGFLLGLVLLYVL